MFDLKLSLIEDDLPISIFSLGTVEVRSHDYVATSKTLGMVFLYIPVLLDGLRGLLENPHWQTCRFDLPASSFSFALKWVYKKPETTFFLGGGKNVHEHKTADVVHVFRNETKRFLNLYVDDFVTETEYEDIKSDLTKFLQEFENFKYS